MEPHSKSVSFDSSNWIDQLPDKQMYKRACETSPLARSRANEFDNDDPTSVLKSSSVKIPKRIILIRHGESLGNVDESIYCTTPDWKVPLTEVGDKQSIESGKKIKELIGDEPISVYCSPYLRTKQTLLGVLSQLQSNRVISAREEPRITEQQFGNFQNHEDMTKFKECRNLFGRFYYRFPEGESGLDVYDRVSLFIGTLWRDWDKIPDIENSNVLVFTHGLTLRLFLMRWYQYTVEEFEQTTNPPNGAVIAMTRYNFPTLAATQSFRNASSSSATATTTSDDIHNAANGDGSCCSGGILPLHISPPPLIPRDRTVFLLGVEYRRLLGLSVSKSTQRLIREKEQTDSDFDDGLLKDEEEVHGSENDGGSTDDDETGCSCNKNKNNSSIQNKLTDETEHMGSDKKKRKSVKLHDRSNVHDLQILLEEARITAKI